MSSLQEQIASRKRRLEALKEKRVNSAIQQPHLPNEALGEEDTPVLKKSKGYEIQVTEGPSKQENNIGISSEDLSGIRPPVDQNQEEDTDTDSDANGELASKIKPTSDLKEKLRPQLEELEERTQEAIKRIVRKRLLTQPGAD
ncbi:LAQU0S16e02674g1_1 [Lachancea quebecensis]|uniref:LAQU0S16e02674g1_1 n=1 Tax=Lachancea quebecensis TaxID=1654605 RepID=A0A0P1KYI9_9SACH|nr:LAQU0S16e02674g1_1 [Lachancea quebecensis]